MAKPTADGEPQAATTGAKEKEAMETGAQEEEEEEWSRVRVEVRADSNGGVKDGGQEGGGTGVLGPTVTVTRERRYRGGFDDGELYKGESASGGVY